MCIRDRDDCGAAFGLIRSDLSGSQVTAVAVIAARPASGTRCFATHLELLAGAEAAVCLASRGELRSHVRVDVHAFGLAVRTIRAADLGALIPVEPQPVHD